MTNLLVSVEELTEEFKPLINRLEKVEEIQIKLLSNFNAVFSDKEAAAYLKVSRKKLQTLRNKREISFVREFMGRKVTYTLAHLLDYLKKNEIKAKK